MEKNEEFKLRNFNEKEKNFHKKIQNFLEKKFEKDEFNEFYFDYLCDSEFNFKEKNRREFFGFFNVLC